jgi:mannose-6-phosphate isomerase
MDQVADCKTAKVLYDHDAKKSGFIQPRIVPKPWGREEWVVCNDRYVMKRLYVNQGHRLSVQYHDVKMETLTVAKGACWLLLGAEGDLDPGNAQRHLFSEGEAIHLNPQTIHTFEAIDDLVLYEVSTPELADVVRLQDLYGRDKPNQ